MTIIQKPLKEQLDFSYMCYAMAVIKDRNIPSVEDGLKPVQRRILWAMYELGLFNTKSHKKSARIIGEVLGKYHPHGDQACYDALVTLAQDFRMRYSIVDGHGNYGSLDGDAPAAMRYTEARLTKYAMFMLQDMDESIVEMADNFDDSLKEPILLPTRVPNILLNGTSGIAVGMATTLLPHNLNEVMDALIALIGDSKLTIKDILKYIKGPDFPLSAIIKVPDLEQLYEEGSGTFRVRSHMHIEGTCLVVTSLPYHVNRDTLLKEIARQELEGVANLVDESSRDGVRIVIEVAEGFIPVEVAECLFKKTRLETTTSLKFLVLVAGSPKQISLLEALQLFLAYRCKIVRKRLEQEKALIVKRLDHLDAVMLALDRIEEIIVLIRKSKHTKEAKTALRSKLGCTMDQATIILDLPLKRLLKMEVEKCKDEVVLLKQRRADINKILTTKKEFDALLISEFQGCKDELGDARRCEIVTEYPDVVNQDFYICYDRSGRLSRVFEHTKDHNSILLEKCVSNDRLLIVTNLGNGYYVDCGKIIEPCPATEYLNLKRNEQIVYIELVDDKPLLCVKENGLVSYVKKKPKDFVLMKFDDKSPVVSVLKPNNKDEILLLTKLGFGIRFNIFDINITNAGVKGVIGISLRKQDKVIQALVNKDQGFYYMTENGFVKRLTSKEIPLQSRSGKGVIVIRATEKTGGFKKAGHHIYNTGSFEFVASDIPYSDRYFSGEPLVNNLDLCS